MLELINENPLIFMAIGVFLMLLLYSIIGNILEIINNALIVKVNSQKLQADRQDLERLKNDA